jgi:hypothetical protein
MSRVPGSDVHAKVQILCNGPARSGAAFRAAPPPGAVSAGHGPVSDPGSVRGAA